jgi:D-sedoheptulose 7-phosphate isomerase
MDESSDSATIFFEETMAEHLDVAARTRNLARLVATAAEEICAALKRGNKALFCGNGGSAADSQHLAAELVVRFGTTRIALPALALTTDTSALTATVNDLGVEHMFARQVAALGAKGDVLIGLTTSGNSPNVIAALQEARRRGLRAICLTGRDGGRAKDAADISIIVPSNSVARIQEMHIVIGHAICAAVDAAFAS